jgi:hypothetical protein
LSSKCEIAESGTGVGVGLEDVCPGALAGPEALELLLPPEPPIEPDVAELDVAIPLVGVVLLRVALLFETLVDAVDRVLLVEAERVELPFDVAKTEFSVEELPDFEEGLSVPTVPFELFEVLPEVEFADAFDIV